MSTLGTSLSAYALIFSVGITFSVHAQKIEQPNLAPDYTPAVEAKNNWTTLLGHCGIEEADVKKACPNLPSWPSIMTKLP